MVPYVKDFAALGNKRGSFPDTDLYPATTFLVVLFGTYLSAGMCPRILDSTRREGC